MKNYYLEPIGNVEKQGELFSLRISADYLPGLTGLQGFSHLWVLWWAHIGDRKLRGEQLVMQKLFKHGPRDSGVFSTRAPGRPNPIMISTIKVLSLDSEHGLIKTSFIDAEEGTPILDIKPYFPMDRVEQCQTPAWCRHWPEWFETAAKYNWENEINFKNP